MLDFSLGELLVIFVVALLVLGPKEIPKLAFMLGRWISYFRNKYYAISAEMKQQMQADFEKKHQEKNNDESLP